MLLTLKDYDRVLVEYKRKKDHFVPVLKEDPENGLYATVQYVRGQIFGIVVATGPGIIGWSLCYKHDEFDKAKGIDLALRRARIAANLSLRDRHRFYSKVPHTLGELFNNMDERSERYFRFEDSED